MRRTVVNSLALATLLAGVGLTLGQQQQAPKVPGTSEPPPAKTTKPPANKSRLEDMLAEALKNNPDLRVAAAKLTKADAELNRTRLQVTQNVVALYYAIDAQKSTIAHHEEKVALAQRAVKNGGATYAEIVDARQALTLAKAKLAELEAQMPALLGKAGRSAEANERTLRLQELGLHTRQIDAIHLAALSATYRLLSERTVQGPLSERIRKALQTPVKVDYKDMSFAEVLTDLEKKAPGLSIRDFPRGNDIKVTLRFKEALPVSAILQALADDYDMGFVVRDYGIRVTNTRAAPPGMMTIEEFLRQKPADAPRGQETKSRNSPAQNVEGLVKRVDESSGLIMISIGSEAGLAKGHTLELYRLAEQPGQSKYLGTLRILEVKEKEAVAQPVGRLSTPPKAGDRVASRVLGN